MTRSDVVPEEPVGTTEPLAGQRVPRGALGVAAALVVILVSLSSRYGWHRDELYFVLCGRHLAWGYVDQPPFVPALARLADIVARGNLVVLRIPAAFVAGAIVLLVTALARELGAERRQQLVAAVLTAVSSLTIAVGHLLSTEDVDVLAGLAMTWFAARAVRTRDPRWLGAAALVAGAALENKYLVALPALGLTAGLVLSGHARLLWSRWVAFGAVAGAVVALPNLVWQVRHSWPELTMASALSEGNGTYGSRPQVLILQLAITAPFFVPILIAGCIAMFRRPTLRPYRFVVWSYVTVIAVVLLAGGKAYYDAPEILALLAPGAIVATDWAQRGRRRLRTTVLAIATAAALTGSAVLFLPLFPTDNVPGFVQAVNEDVDGMVGWPSFATQVEAAYRAIPRAPGRRPPALLTESYSDAGALARFGPARGLPQAYSGHNSMADFGRPPDGTQTVLAVGWGAPDQLRQWFTSVTPAGTIHSGIHTETDTDGERMWLCTGPRQPWSVLWLRMRHID